MSENEEKTEPPSELKLSEARKKGQVAKSADLSAAVSLLAIVLFLLCYSSSGLERISSYLRHTYAMMGGSIDMDMVQGWAKKGLNLWLILSLPLCLAAALGAMFGNVGQIGFLLTSKPLNSDFKRIDPIKGLKKILGKDKWIELLKQILKFTLVLVIIFSSFKSSLYTISLLPRISLEIALIVMGQMVLSISIKIVTAFLAIGVLDYFWQRFSFRRSLKMSRSELKKEHKQQEGDPLLKAERKRRWHEALESTPIQVKNSTLVVVNPSHLAIALHYDEDCHQAPVVIAKGLGPLAKEIIREASHNQVPIIRNVALARDLWWLNINEEIPESLFNSVAEILTFIYELSHKKSAQDKL